MVERQLRDQPPGRAAVQGRLHWLSWFFETNDFLFWIKRSRLFNLQEVSGRKFPGQLAIRAERMSIDSLHRGQTGLEIEVQK